ncbi:hypothetical protein OAV88_01865 [bacterium]|nr:hypothetical protein [bacterium]
MECPLSGNVNPIANFACSEIQCENFTLSSVTGAVGVTCPNGYFRLNANTSCSLRCDPSLYIDATDVLSCPITGGTATTTLSCLELPCDNVNITSSTNCSTSTISSQSSCHFECAAQGYTRANPIGRCDYGVWTPASPCSADSCDGISAPSDGDFGGCTSTLSSGQSCTYGVNVGAQSSKIFCFLSLFVLSFLIYI